MNQPKTRTIAIHSGLRCLLADIGISVQRESIVPEAEAISLIGGPFKLLFKTSRVAPFTGYLAKFHLCIRLTECH
jgi:hypothetical protein